MKQILFLSSFILAVFFAQAQWQRGRLQATGLTCSMCSNAIHKSLEKLPFIDQVEADIAKSMFILSFKAMAAIDPDRLREAIEEAGFAVGSLELDANVTELPTIASKQHLIWSGFQFHLRQAVSELPPVGTWVFRFQDKGFVPTTRYRKLVKAQTDPCLVSGKRSVICVDHPAKSERIYHIELIAAQ
jgi:copper chaperone CopZ